MPPESVKGISGLVINFKPMKPNSPQQLARLLDQVGGLYPNGIPVSVITAPQQDEVQPAVNEARPYHLIIVGGEISQVERELLEGIVSKGLRVSASEYSVSYVPDEGAMSLASGSLSERVIVFGSSRENGFLDRERGHPALFAYSLEKLAGDAGMKKEFWRALQTVISAS